MKVRLIAVDMDGTLLDPDDAITPATVKAVARARAAGIPVVPATGRPERLIWDRAAEAGLGPLGVGANGAVILDLEAGVILERSGFSGPAAVALVDLLRTEIPGISLAADEGDQFFYETEILDDLTLRARPGRLEVLDVRDRVQNGCVKLVARRADLTSIELARIMSPLLRNGSSHAVDTSGMNSDQPDDLAEVTASDIAWVDIGPPGFSKATGLANVCARLGIDLGDVAAIGDHYNDLPMLRAVGLPAAVGNAIPDVLALARRVMPSNADDGVAAFIDEVVGAG